MSWLLRHPTVLLVVSCLLLLGGALGLAAWWTLRPVVIEVADELPAEFPSDGFSHASFEVLLGRFVDGTGDVDYDAWSKDAEALTALDRYLAALARYSPDTAPERFPEEADRLAYYLNAYNACVIKGVLLHWPLKSVRDVKAPIDVVKGLGFFGKLRFVIGGQAMSLYHLENGLIRTRFTDPRIHFVLNCASGGCPRLRPDLPTGDALEPYLATSTAEFVADPKNVEVDHDAQVIRVSAIFSWYREDFTSELARRGLPTEQRTLTRYITLVAGEAQREDLERAADYSVEVKEYDWGVNAQ